MILQKFNAVAFMAAIPLILNISCSQETDIRKVLTDAADSGVPLYGHQDDLMYGHSWRVTADECEFDRSDVYATAGAYPFILGLDLGGIELDNCENLDGNDFTAMRRAALKHWQRGGLLALSWHSRNPLTGGDSWDVSDDTTVESILPGGIMHDKFMGWLDKVCDYIISLRDDDGRQIPVIWRPLHEHNGDWFWWCASECSAEQYNSLWIMMHDYMTKVRKVGGLMWEISPGSLGLDLLIERYPGDEYVDIIGLDCYCHGDASLENTIPDYIAKVRASLDFLKDFASSRNKILAFSETGYESIPDAEWWSKALAPALEGYPVSYVLTWRNANDEGKRDWHYFSPWPGSSSEKDFVEWTSSGKVKLLK